MKKKNQYTKLLNKLYSNSDIIKNAIILFLSVIFLDYLNIFSKLPPTKELLFVYGGISIFILIKFFKFKPWNLFKLKTVNYIDAFFASSRIATLIYMFSLLISPCFYKVISCLIINIFICTLESYRIITINKAKNNQLNTVHDLKELYEGKLVNDDTLVLIKEDDVNYDLLDRGNVINRLIHVIKNCYTHEKFVISLEGSWGSGKTTILNNLKKYINADGIILIDDFDPWAYEDEKSLFRGMFDAIMRKIGINFSIININKFFNTYMDTFFYNSKYENQYSLFKKYYTNYDGTNKIREIINDYLKLNNKRILFIIDNIERAEKENIIFLFKLINNILNFDNTIYLLSFDDEKMKKIFKEDLNIDYSYLKKIIQLEVKVPKIDKNIFNNVASTCIKNLLKLYQIHEMSDSDINLISENIDDLRELKRYLNSVITFQYNSNNYLNCTEAFLLEIIKKESPELFDKIEKNKQFFVSQDTHLDGTIYTLNTQEFNEKGKKFFDELFENTEEKYKRILAKLFPYVSNYIKGRNLREEYIISDSESYNDSILNKRISNARYFDLYFTQNQNEFTLINTKVENFIKFINNNSNYKVIEQQYVDMISLYDNWIQKFIFEILEISLNKVNSDKKFFLLKVIYNNIDKCDDSTIFLGLNSLSRIEAIIAEIIQDISEEDFNEFEQILQKNNSNLYLIQQIIYWLGTPSKGAINKDQLINKLEKIYKNKIDKIINNNINLLNNNNYVRKNLWGLYHGTKDNENLIKEYMKNILNENTIFRFLNEMISRSLGTKFGYKISDESINLFTTRENIENILTNIKRELADDEKLLINLFYNHNSKKDELYLNFDKKFNV